MADDAQEITEPPGKLGFSTPRRVGQVVDSRYCFYLLLVTRLFLAVVFAGCLTGFLYSDIILTKKRSTIILLALSLILLCGYLVAALSYLSARRCCKSVRDVKMCGVFSSASQIIIYWGLANAVLASALIPLSIAIEELIHAYATDSSAVDSNRGTSQLDLLKAAVQGLAAILFVLAPLYRDDIGLWIPTMIAWLVIAVTWGAAIFHLRRMFHSDQR